MCVLPIAASEATLFRKPSRYNIILAAFSCILFSVPSFEEKYYLTNPSLLQRVRRDIALFMDSFAFLVVWLTQGRKIRRAYRQAQLDNTEIILEDLMEEDQQ